MAFRLHTAPAELAVSLEEQKRQCRVLHNRDDLDLTDRIKAAVRMCEQHCRRAFVRQVWEKALDAFPAGGGAIELPVPPLLEVQAIEYVDPNGAWQEINPAHYAIDSYSEPGWVMPSFGRQWPATRAQPLAVRVRYVAGFGGPQAVPDDIKSAIKLQAAHFYKNREAVTDKPTYRLELAVEDLLSPYVIRDIA